MVNINPRRRLLKTRGVLTSFKDSLIVKEFDKRLFGLIKLPLSVRQTISSEGCCLHNRIGRCTPKGEHFQVFFGQKAVEDE